VLWRALGRRPPPDIGTPHRPLASTLFIPGQLPVLAQADLEEHQEQCSAQPNQHQGDHEDLAGQSADEDGAHRAGDNEHGRGPKREYA
jgi:hypothetical protein